jgi:hypothetical protein
MRDLHPKEAVGNAALQAHSPGAPAPPPAFPLHRVCGE